jgi:hypothetical protein
LQTEGTTEILSSLSLTGTSGAGRCTSHGEVERLSEGNVTPIGEGRDDESTDIADEFVVVPGLPIANGGDARLEFVLGVLLLHAELQLGSPHEVTLLLDLLVNESLGDISGMHVNSNDSDDLNTGLHDEVASNTENQLADAVSDHA